MLRNPGFVEQGTRITLASAWLSALWWALLSVVLTLNLLHVPDDPLTVLFAADGGVPASGVAGKQLL